MSGSRRLCPTPFPLRACQQPLPSRNPGPQPFPGGLLRRPPGSRRGRGGSSGRWEGKNSSLPSPPLRGGWTRRRGRPRPAPPCPPAASRPWPRCRRCHPPPTCCLVVSGERGPGKPSPAGFAARPGAAKAECLSWAWVLLKASIGVTELLLSPLEVWGPSLTTASYIWYNVDKRQHLYSGSTSV